MQEMTAQSWKRRGCSIVWSPELLAPLITSSDAVPLRTALAWSRDWQQHGPPDSLPGNPKTVLIGGLQTALEVMSDADTSSTWLRSNILPLSQRWCKHWWPGIGLVFGLDGPGRRFELNEADDLVYYGKGSDRESKLCLTRAIWNGAATGKGVFKLMVESTTQIGGFHVIVS